MRKGILKKGKSGGTKGVVRAEKQRAWRDRAAARLQIKGRAENEIDEREGNEEEGTQWLPSLRGEEGTTRDKA